MHSPQRHGNINGKGASRQLLQLRKAFVAESWIFHCALKLGLYLLEKAYDVFSSELGIKISPGATVFESLAAKSVRPRIIPIGITQI